jgi:hypothetical protein
MICFKCGKKVSDHARRCEDCRIWLEDNPIDKSQNKQCPNCGFYTSMKLTICSCGYNFATEEVINLNEPQEAKKKCPYCDEDISIKAVKCKHCSESLCFPPTIEAGSNKTGSPLLQFLGATLFLVGLGFAVYYWAYFDTSVQVEPVTLFGNTIGGGRVHNIGLMQERQTGLILSVSGSCLGFVLLIVERFMAARSKS